MVLVGRGKITFNVKVKLDDINKVTDYQPIIILCSFSKVFESCIFEYVE